MNSTVRVLMLSLLSVAVLAGCKSKSTQADTPPPAGPSTGAVTNPGPTTPGAYGPGDLDTDACLRQRVVYFFEPAPVAHAGHGQEIAV